jgi:hypothetical protein
VELADERQSAGGILGFRPQVVEVGLEIEMQSPRGWSKLSAAFRQGFEHQIGVNLTRPSGTWPHSSIKLILPK